MPDDPVVLGVNAAHDASAALVVDGQLRAAVAEERFSRRKHHHTSPPLRAIDRCLEAGGLPDRNAVDCIVVNERYPSADFAGEVRRGGFRGELLAGPSHHLLHACYAAAASGQAETAILVVDGSGYTYGDHRRHGSPLLGEPPPSDQMEETESSFALRDGRIELVERRWGLWDADRPYFRFPSLGHMYSAASRYIFGVWMHAGKTMGLAPYGDPDALPDPIVTYEDGTLQVDTEWVLGLPRRSERAAHEDEVCRNVAAKVQAEVERAMLFLAGRLFDATGIPHVSLSGGVALNSVANARLRRESPFTGMFVTPAAGDTGIAVGAAVHGHVQLTGRVPCWTEYSDFLGPEHGAGGIDAALGAAGTLTRVARPADPPGDAAGEIAAGAVAGWFEGRSELGPRALGHRSIVCDPRGDSIRDRLNSSVKFREPFRPYAASVLEEHAGRYFEVEWVDRFMLSVVQIRPEHRALLPGICHVDNSCRIQMVPPGSGGYRQLIEAFFELTGLPLILNTSLNIRGEPTVETPAQAIECFLGTNLDLLYMEGRRVEKERLDPADPDDSLVPCPNPGVELDPGQASWRQGSWQHSAPHARIRTGHRFELGEMEAALLPRVDGETPVGEMVADGDGAAQLAALASLQRRGLIAMKAATRPR